MHYVECWRAIQAANRIFGFNGWSSDIVSLEKEFMGPEKDGKWVAMYSAVVRVELKDGTSHTETGSGDAKDRDRAKAVENARKEAVSDATKRALAADHGGTFSFEKCMIGLRRSQKETGK